jgi:hypothetical protein
MNNGSWKKWIKSLPQDAQVELIERQLRVLPQFIMEETAKLPPQYNQKVVKNLEGKLKIIQGLWSEILIARHAQ